MAKQQVVHGFTTWTIVAHDGVTRATFVPDLGAIGSSLVLPGIAGEARETLFQHDFFWQPDTTMTRGGLPFLFPICGRLELDGQAETYHDNGQPYSMKIHGFAHRLPWRVLDSTDPASLEMVLSDTPETRLSYPFEFEIRLTYRVTPGALFCEQRYSNRGNRPLPYYAGFHPYFLTPPPKTGKSEVRLDLKPAHWLCYNATLTNVIGEKTVTTDFPLAITDPALHEQLLRMGTDKQARLLFPDGFRLNLRADSIDDPDRFPYLQLYTLPDKPFICVEPWMGVPNALNTLTSVRRLAPGQSETARLRIGTDPARSAPMGSSSD